MLHSDPPASEGKPISERRSRNGKTPAGAGVFTLLGYLDSNQEQLEAVGVTTPPSCCRRIPRVSAVFIGPVYSLLRAGTG